MTYFPGEVESAICDNSVNYIESKLHRIMLVTESVSPSNARRQLKALAPASKVTDSRQLHVECESGELRLKMAKGGMRKPMKVGISKTCAWNLHK